MQLNHIVWGKSTENVEYPSKRGAENVFAKMVPVRSLDSKSGVCQAGIVEHFEKMAKLHNGRFLTLVIHK